MIWRVKRKWERAKVHKPNTTFYFGLTTYELVPEYELPTMDTVCLLVCILLLYYDSYV